MVLSRIPVQGQLYGSIAFFSTILSVLIYPNALNEVVILILIGSFIGSAISSLEPHRIMLGFIKNKVTKEYDLPEEDVESTLNGNNSSKFRDRYYSSIYIILSFFLLVLILLFIELPTINSESTFWSRFQGNFLIIIVSFAIIIGLFLKNRSYIKTNLELIEYLTVFYRYQKPVHIGYDWLPLDEQLNKRNQIVEGRKTYVNQAEKYLKEGDYTGFKYVTKHDIINRAEFYGYSWLKHISLKDKKFLNSNDLNGFIQGVENILQYGLYTLSLKWEETVEESINLVSYFKEIQESFDAFNQFNDFLETTEKSYPKLNISTIDPETHEYSIYEEIELKPNNDLNKSFNQTINILKEFSKSKNVPFFDNLEIDPNFKMIFTSQGTDLIIDKFVVNFGKQKLQFYFHIFLQYALRAKLMKSSSLIFLFPVERNAIRDNELIKLSRDTDFSFYDEVSNRIDDYNLALSNLWSKFRIWRNINVPENFEKYIEDVANMIIDKIQPSLEKITSIQNI